MEKQSKFRLLVAIALLFPVAVQAQTSATTEDGKKVILNTDGTWKYAEAPPGVTLRIEAGIVYAAGPSPVARTAFMLLDTDPVPEIMNLPRTPAGNFDGVDQLSFSCRHNDYPAAPAIVRKYIRYTLTTGFDGKAELADIKSGKYWLVGVAPTRGIGCVLWLMEVDLSKNQSLVLDQHNARRKWQY